MLRASAAATNTDVDLQSIVDDDVDSNLPHGALLTSLAEALVRRAPELAALRKQAIEEIGPTALIEAVGSAANFQRMTRIADAIGVPVDPPSAAAGADLQEQLGLDRFAGALNTP